MYIIQLISYIPFCRCNRSLPQGLHTAPPLSKTPGTATAPGLRSSRRRRAHSRPGRGPGDASRVVWRSHGGFEWEKHEKNNGKTMGISWEYHGNIMDSGDLTPRNGNIKWEYKN